jgi:Holliday junction resolvase-like predicted endonuclease
MTPSIRKSTRHSKITGDFAESLVLYWLSKHGFECAKVDHTGMDLIARNPHTDELMGISVKSRSRNTGTEHDVVRLGAPDEALKLSIACKAFACKPYFAIVVDAGTTIRCYIAPLARVTARSKKRKHLYWPMSQKHLDQYNADQQLVAFEFESTTSRWWPSV